MKIISKKIFGLGIMAMLFVVAFKASLVDVNAIVLNNTQTTIVNNTNAPTENKVELTINKEESLTADTTAVTSTIGGVPKASDLPAEIMHNYVKLLISTITTEDMTPEQKLRACFDYELDHMKYKRDESKASGESIEDYALEAFFTGRGNCYRFASMFAYMAKELGYDAYVEAGDCTSSKGGLTPHSWCVIDYPDGRSLVYDLSFADANRKANFYGIEHEEHTRKLYPYEKWEVKY